MGEAEAILKERSSKFLALAYHVESAEEVRDIMEPLRKKFYDATHHCYAYRIGYRGEEWRANDDGEPSGTAGKPILGQLLSRDITNTLVVVVRWFGGTKLGVPGLIETYRESTVAVLDVAKVEERTIDQIVTIHYPFESMNGVMKAIKATQPRIVDQQFDNMCSMKIAVRLSDAEQLIARLEKVDGVAFEDETTL